MGVSNCYQCTKHKVPVQYHTISPQCTKHKESFFREGKMLKFLFVLPCLLAVVQPQSTRSLVQMVEMVIHVVDCSFFPIPYGCWCGFTLDPEPDMPSIDAFDESCKIHDFCYDSAVTSGCDSYDEYLWPYEWIIDENDEIVCVEDQPDCQKQICNFDRNVAYAFNQVSEVQDGCPWTNPGCNFTNPLA